MQEEKRAAVAATAALPVSFPVGREQNIPLPAEPVPRARPGRTSTKTCAECTDREVTKRAHTQFKRLTQCVCGDGSQTMHMCMSCTRVRVMYTGKERAPIRVRLHGFVVQNMPNLYAARGT